MAHKLAVRIEINTGLRKSRCERVSQIVHTEMLDSGILLDIVDRSQHISAV